MKFILVLSFLRLIFGSTTCSVNQDVTTTIANWIPTYFAAPLSEVKQEATILANVANGAGTIINYAPFAGLNSTTRQYLWSMVQSTGYGAAVGYQNLEYLDYYDYGSDGWILSYNAPNSLLNTAYYVDPVTGEATSVYATSTYNVTGRPWYRETIAAAGSLLMTKPYGSREGIWTAINAGQAFYKNGVLEGVLAVYLCLNPACGLPTLSQSLVAMNTNPGVVTYVMETATGIMLVSS